MVYEYPENDANEKSATTDTRPDEGVGTWEGVKMGGVGVGGREGGLCRKTVRGQFVVCFSPRTQQQQRRL